MARFPCTDHPRDTVAPKGSSSPGAGGGSSYVCVHNGSQGAGEILPPGVSMKVIPEKVSI